MPLELHSPGVEEMLILLAHREQAEEGRADGQDQEGNQGRAGRFLQESERFFVSGSTVCGSSAHRWRLSVRVPGDRPSKKAE